MLKAAMIFSDHMVLQRDKAVPVWGSADPGAAVTVAFDQTKVQTIADRCGNWTAILPPHAAGWGYTLQIGSGSQNITFRDVCVGEVWLAGGQSNMEYHLGFEKHIDEVLAGEMNPMIRFFDYPEVSYEGQLEDYHYHNEGFWRSCTPKDLPWFSAVGYYFAQQIQKAQNVPVGIVGCNWGGTPACAWMAPENLKGTDAEVWLRRYEDAVRDLDIESYQAAFRANPGNDRTDQLGNAFNEKVMKIGLTLEEQRKFMESMPDLPEPFGPWYERRPGGLYETMLKKVHPYAIRGVIWYQGESDADYPEEYVTAFSQMIRCWRELWQEEFPFLFVQLAPFERWLACEGVNYPRVRASQETVSKSVPNTWMASIGDAGMQWDIHPKDKVPVGTRLALLARGHVYGEHILCDAPEAVCAERQADDIVVTFHYAEGLHIQGDRLQAMVGLNEAGECMPIADAEVREDRLILHGCSGITALHFAWSGYYEVNLYNAAGIPAKPFQLLLPEPRK